MHGLRALEMEPQGILWLLTDWKRCINSLHAPAGLFLCRASVGLGEGVAPSASTDMIARLVRAQHLAIADTGYVYMWAGAGMLQSPLAGHLGWIACSSPVGRIVEPCPGGDINLLSSTAFCTEVTN